MFKDHPKGLRVLFMTEMWERFSYYGIRAVLVLFMTAGVDSGGLGFDIVKATSVLGLFTSMAYLMNMPGGWVADKILGLRTSVFIGGILISAGNFLIFLPTMATFYIGLAVIVLGTGLLKPNVSAIVGQLYGTEDKRKDAGFYVFYMGINLGAFIAPLICSTLSEKIDWHLGFLAASIGMILGLIQYRLGYKHLGEAGLSPVVTGSNPTISKDKTKLYIGMGILSAVVLLLYVLNDSAVIAITPNVIADSFTYVLLAFMVIFFSWLLIFAKWEAKEKDRLIVISIFFFAAALFWSAFEQAASSLNLFAEEITDKSLPNWMVDFINPLYSLFADPLKYNSTFPTGWFQSLNSLFIIILAPIFATLWLKLGNREPSSPAKFAVALILVGVGFGILIIPGQYGSTANQVSPMWLTVLYFVHTAAELCLSPVGLSKVTSLSPPRVVGLMMGVWFLGSSVGNFVAARFSGLYGSLPLTDLFGIVFAFSAGLGLIMFLFIKPIRRMMHGVH